jgi:hypothetical protein
MKDIVMSLGQYPVVGTALSGLNIALGYFIGFMVDIPLIVMQLAQLGVWLLGICVSAATIIGWLKKNTTFVDHWKFLK